MASFSKLLLAKVLFLQAKMASFFKRLLAKVLNGVMQQKQSNATVIVTSCPSHSCHFKMYVKPYLFA